MRRGFGTLMALVTSLVLAHCGGGQTPNATVVASEESLQDSFAMRIEKTDLVTDFRREGGELIFTGPDGAGGAVAWRVVVDSLFVEAQEFDEERPYVGRITSIWHANGEVVEYLGNMTALPDVYLDRGLGQKCWAFWIEADKRWDW